MISKKLGRVLDPPHFYILPFSAIAESIFLYPLLQASRLRRGRRCSIDNFFHPYAVSW